MAYLNKAKQLSRTLRSMKCNVNAYKISMAPSERLISSLEDPIVALDALSNDDRLLIFDFVKHWFFYERRSQMLSWKSVKKVEGSALMFRWSTSSNFLPVCMPQIVVARRNLSVPTVVVMGTKPTVVGVEMLLIANNHLLLFVNQTQLM